MLTAALEVEENALETLNHFLRSLLEKRIVEALLVPQRLTPGGDVAPTLVCDPERMAAADPLAPVMPVSSAKLVSDLTRTGNEKRLGAVMRSCEIRALIELTKLRQAKLDNLIVIGVDCLGTYEMSDYAKLAASGASPGMELLAKAREGLLTPHQGYQFRAACRMCERPIPEGADIAIGIIGVDTDKEILLTTSDEMAERLGLTPAEVPPEREEAIQRLISERMAERDRAFADFRSRVADIQGLLAEFSSCIRCHNCMVACPICYCKECIFRTEVFDHPSPRYFKWAERKGVIRMPADTLIFHLTRLNHMATSCVGCGMCESACPNDIPLATIFRAVGQKVQALFDYVPGRSLEEELPLATFREDELEPR